MNYTSFYEGTIASEQSKDIYDLSGDSSSSRLLLIKLINGMKQFVNWLVRIILKLMNSIRNLWNKVNTFFAKMRGDKFVVDEFGYMDKINDAKPILDQYYDCVIQLNKIDHQIYKGQTFEDRTMSYVGNGVKDSMNLGGRRSTKRDFAESFTNYMVQAERQKNILGKLLEEAHQDIPAKQPRSYSVSVLKKTIDTEFNSRLARMKDLQYQLMIVKKTYEDSSNIVVGKIKGTLGIGKLGKNIKRNNSVLKHCSALISYTEEFKMLQVKLVNQAEEIEIDEKEVAIAVDAVAA